jgi:hypothetical protein
MTTKTLLKYTDYRHIKAWGAVMQSFQYYVVDQQQRAAEDQAPVNAIYRKDDGTWSTADDIQRPDLRKYVNFLAGEE